MALVVLFFLAVGHAWSIGTGLFLDDHAHYRQLREGDWSFRSAVEASRLGVVGDVMRLWGRSEAGLRFFRPVAFWLMRLEYTLAGWEPMRMHLFSLGWHFLCAMLVGVLAWRCLGERLWATVAAALMAIHPGHTGTVFWIACQTELMATAFVLISVLAYARHAGWGGRWFVRERGGSRGGVGEEPGRLSVPRRAGDRLEADLTIAAPRREDASRPSVAPGSSTGPGGLHRPPGAAASGSGARVFGVMALAAYGLALGCRENTLLLPLVLWAGDRLLGTERRGLVRWEHVGMVLIAAGYLALRSVMLGGLELPSRPYLMPVDDPEFAAFILNKTVYYTLGLFGYTPVVPIGGMAYFAARPVAFYGGFALTVLVFTGVWAAYRFRRELLWPVVWIGCLIVPVMPVFASSHHLYLPSVGAVLLITAAIALLGGVVRVDGVSKPRRRPVLCGIVLALHGFGLGLLTWACGFAYVRGTVAEDIVIDDVVRRGPALEPGDRLFFINLPILAYYAVPAIEQEAGIRGLHGHVLTFAPTLNRVESPGEVEVLDARTLRVRAPAGRRYFEGVTGRTLLEAMGFDRMPAEGEPIDAELYTVVPTAADEHGITELVFTFRQPLDSPGYRFYFGSPWFLAYPLDVSCSPDDDPL